MYACRAKDAARLVGLYLENQTSGAELWMPYWIKVGETEKFTNARYKYHEVCVGGEIEELHSQNFKDKHLAEQLAHKILESIGKRRHMVCSGPSPAHGNHSEWFTPAPASMRGAKKLSIAKWADVVKAVIDWVHDEAPDVLKDLLIKYDRVLV